MCNKTGNIKRSFQGIPQTITAPPGVLVILNLSWLKWCIVCEGSTSSLLRASSSREKEAVLERVVVLHHKGGFPGVVRLSRYLHDNSIELAALGGFDWLACKL